MSRHRTPAPIRALLIAMLLCVLAVRVIVPQGFMWTTSGNGTPAMVACPGMMPATPAPAMSKMSKMSAMHHGDRHDHDGRTADHPCAFAAAGAAVDLAAMLHPLAVIAAARVAPVARLHIFARPGLGLAAPPPPKTGPPSLA